MASRADEMPLRGTMARTASRPAARARYSRGQRLLFAFSLLTFGLASVYTSVALLSRITPALFPGQTLTSINIGGRKIGEIIPLPHQSKESAFFDPINLLIIGIDNRPGDTTSPGRTDTIMVATIDPIGKTTNVISFPRDMWIDIHLPNGQKTQDRINASYGLGFEMGGRTFEAGARQLKLDIEKDFGIEIDNTVLLDFTGVETLVDAIGGVEVDIPEDLSVPRWWYSNDDLNARYVSFPAGPNALDGYLAVAFGRYREDSDFKRVKRQQVVVQAAMQKVFARGILSDWPSLWDAYSSTIETDLSKTKMVGLVPLLKQTGGRMKTFSLADPVDGRQTLRDYTTPGGAAVETWDPDNVQYWLSQAFPKAKYALASVEIQNGYGSGGDIRAAALGRFLAYVKGLPTVALGPDAPAQPGTVIVLYGEDRRAMAEDIAQWMELPPSVIRTQSRNDDALPDVVIVIGRDFKLPGG
jgi:LCP family protein required for cell wall assembly